jgi:hypothetical protein
MHLHSLANDLVSEIESTVEQETNPEKKQALEDCKKQAEYLATRLGEIGSE